MKKRTKKPRSPSRPLRAIPLGGLGEIGKNCTVIEYGDDLLVVDAGVAFPGEELFGIDLVIPDFSHIIERKARVHGVVLTHGHEDHTGGLPFLLRDLDAPVAGRALTLGLAARKSPEMQAHELEPRERARFGPFEVELIHVNHSIPDAAAVAVRTPAGLVVLSGDFKFDTSPIDERPTDMARLAELGEEGVAALLLDSTNAEVPGHTPSERTVAPALDAILGGATGRVLITTFASNVHRLQQVFDLAHRHGRAVAIVGRSMTETIEVAGRLGRLTVPSGTLVQVEEAAKLPDERVAFLTTGSQGEPLSALTRIALGTHHYVQVRPGDTVVFAATPIPGNEAMVARTINQLYKAGAEVITPRVAPVHVSGHAAQQELQMMTSLLRPRTLVPVHGEYRHLVANRRLAMATGIPAERILLGENGTAFEVGRAGGAIAGQVRAGNVLVDGLTFGDMESAVLRDRRHLARGGVVFVLAGVNSQTGGISFGPEIVARGISLDHGDLLAQAKRRVRRAMERARSQSVTDWGALATPVTESLRQLFAERTGRQPMIVPMIVEV